MKGSGDSLFRCLACDRPLPASAAGGAQAAAVPAARGQAKDTRSKGRDKGLKQDHADVVMRGGSVRSQTNLASCLPACAQS